MRNDARVTGEVDIIAEDINGNKTIYEIKNTILLNGRMVMSKVLANDIGETFQYYVSRMIFGDGGTIDGVKKYVNANREGLFGVTRLSKPVLSNLDTSVPAQVIFTSVIKFDEAVGISLNEMALQLANGTLYSMTTFPDLNKTSELQLTLNWRINML